MGPLPSTHSNPGRIGRAKSRLFLFEDVVGEKVANGFPDFVRRILLDEVDAFDGHGSLVRPIARPFLDCVREEAGLSVDVKLRKIIGSG